VFITSISLFLHLQPTQNTFADFVLLCCVCFGFVLILLILFHLSVFVHTFASNSNNLCRFCFVLSGLVLVCFCFDFVALVILFDLGVFVHAFASNLELSADFVHVLDFIILILSRSDHGGGLVYSPTRASQSHIKTPRC